MSYSPYFITLTTDHPAPWSINYWPRRDALMNEVFHRETHTGDGDQIYYEDHVLEELVRMINLEFELQNKPSL